MSRFSVTNLPFTELKLLHRKRLEDHRGFFERLFCAEELVSVGWKEPIAQINFTHTMEQGTVRGMHFQYPPHCEKKMVTCIQGEVWDVVIDLREGSPTFLQWHAELLSDENLATLFIPEGFAHGFQATRDNTKLLYFHSAAYSPEAEAGINPFDRELAITWPLPIAKISTRDNNHPMIDQNFKGIRL